MTLDVKTGYEPVRLPSETNSQIVRIKPSLDELQDRCLIERLVVGDTWTK